MNQSISNPHIHSRILREVNRLQRGAPFVIGVNGIDGSGKTVFSNGLAQFLEEQGTETIVILEGIFIFRKDLLRYFNLKIFLEISFAESLRRALARDKQIQAHEIEERYRVKYHPGQDLYLRLNDPKSAADIVINNEDYSNPYWSGDGGS